METIEKRVFLRLTGDEAEYLQNHINWEDNTVALSIHEKLRGALGRANRLQHVLETNPAKTIKDWERGRYYEVHSHASSPVRGPDKE